MLLAPEGSSLLNRQRRHLLSQSLLAVERLLRQLQQSSWLLRLSQARLSSKRLQPSLPSMGSSSLQTRRLRGLCHRSTARHLGTPLEARLNSLNLTTSMRQAVGVTVRLSQMFMWLPREQHGIKQTESHAKHQQYNSLESLDDHKLPYAHIRAWEFGVCTIASLITHACALGQ